MPGDGSRIGKLKDNDFTGDVNSFGYQSSPKEEAMLSRASASPKIPDPRIEASKKSVSSMSALKELVSIRNETHTS